MIGVYKITNLLNGDCYVGSSKDIGLRWDTHLSIYNKHGVHYEYHMYRAFRKYGVVSFKFEVIEECKQHELITREQYYYDLLKPKYNNIKPSENPMDNPNVLKKHMVKCKKSWLNRSDTAKEHAFENLKKGADSTNSNKFQCRKIKAIKLITGEDIVFESLYEAEKELSIPRSSISQILNDNHIRKQSKGYKFEYCN